MVVGAVGWTVVGTLGGVGALAFRRYTNIVTACTKAVGLCRGAALNHSDKKFRVAITGKPFPADSAVTEILSRYQPQVSLVLLVRDVQAGNKIARTLAERHGVAVPPAVIYCDLTSKASVENATKELGDMWFADGRVPESQGFDAVIHNAGIMLPRDKVISTNLVAPVLMSERLMRARAEASVQRALRMVYVSREASLKEYYDIWVQLREKTRQKLLERAPYTESFEVGDRRQEPYLSAAHMVVGVSGGITRIVDETLQKRSLLVTADDVVSVLGNSATTTQYPDSKRAILSYVASKSGSPSRDPSTKFVACTPGFCNTNLGAPFLPGVLYSALAPFRWLLLRDSTEGAVGVLKALLDTRVENGDFVDSAEVLEHLPRTRPDLFVGEAVKNWAMS
ncbi:hypothetical protein FOL46_005802 [Perkinsus olseni]|uniref:Uncharacterized protein n=1 Tax=Perkinsus olseni TaxID=32597 RepID=A0A7J6MR72_PEROL|nr:hypothetical protein FOL46_005802 [Perkinsus olseni]